MNGKKNGYRLLMGKLVGKYHQEGQDMVAWWVHNMDWLRIETSGELLSIQ
jgi:hypothetical protein